MSVDSLPPLEDLRVLRRAQVLAVTGLSESRIRQLERAGQFPRRIALGAGAVAYREIEVRQWLAARSAEPLQARGNARPALPPTAAPATPVRAAKAIRKGAAR